MCWQRVLNLLDPTYQYFLYVTKVFHALMNLKTKVVLKNKPRMAEHFYSTGQKNDSSRVRLSGPLVKVSKKNV